MNSINSLYIDIPKAKSYLILLVCITIAHFAFNSTKSYVYTVYNGRKIESIRIYSGEEYKELLKIMTLRDYAILPKRVEKRYLYIFPEQAVLIIYIGYIIALCGLILSIRLYRFEDSELTNQERLAKIPKSEKAKMMFLIKKTSRAINEK